MPAMHEDDDLSYPPALAALHRNLRFFYQIITWELPAIVRLLGEVAPVKALSNIRMIRLSVVVTICLCSALATAVAAPGSVGIYLVHNLVSDLPDTADFQDKNLVNPWGIAASASGPFWIGNNGTSTSTIYSTNGAPSGLVVTVPTPALPTGGAVTGVISNATTAFTVTSGGKTKNASFIFCTEDGTISGWSPTVNATAAIVAVDQSASGAVFKACVAGGTAAAPLIYVTDFHNGAVDVFDGSFHQVVSATAFLDPLIPAGFAPFGIANFAGSIYVTYAQQNAAKHDDVAGAGNGFVDVFDGSGTFLRRLITRGALNSPWGMAMAPATFGQFGGALLVGNFGGGIINAFDPATGNLLGTLQDNTGHNIPLPGLWSLFFGNGGKGGDPATLYFTAGIAGPYGETPESHGLFGSIQAAPSFISADVVNGASFAPLVGANTWTSIFGGGLASTTRSWAATDFTGAKLPINIDGVGVTVNGEAAYVSFVSPMQLNFLTPTDIPAGPVQIQVTNNGEVSAAVTATMQNAAPGFFWLTGNKYIAATHANGGLIGPISLISGATTPAARNETIVLYGAGFGVTSPAAPNGSALVTPLPLVMLPTVTIGGASTQVTYGGLVGAGLYQINVVVPASVSSGDNAVVASVGGQQSQANAFISVQ
jgi:uncharacterized protein (TIGR03118 family)